MENMSNVKIHQGGPAASRLVRLALIGGAGLYAASNSLFNVEGGHRAIVFNRLVGIKDEVGARQPASLVLSAGHLVEVQQDTQTTALSGHSASHCAGV